MENKNLFIVSFLVLIALSVGIFQYVKFFQSEIVSAYDASKPINGHSWTEMQCTTDVCVDTVNHRMGIGTDSPTEALEVTGDIFATGDICNGTSKCLSSVYETNIIAGSNPTCSSGSIIMKAYNGTWYTGDNASITTWTKVVCGNQVTNDGTPLLVNNIHTEKNCTDQTSLSGTVVSDGAGHNMCKLTTSACPSGWTQYLNWSTTTTGSVPAATTATSCTSCSVPACSGATAPAGHTWGNVARESSRNCAHAGYDPGYGCFDSACGYNAGYAWLGLNVCGSFSCVNGTCYWMNNCVYTYSNITQIGCY